VTTKRLGKGLSALIRGTIDEIKSPESISRIPIDLISPNPYQPRQDLESDESKMRLEELANSIKEKGIIQPVTVRTKNGTYELIVGERRWRAAKMAGLEEISAHVVEIDDEIEMMQYALIENIQRENLNVIEEAKAFDILRREYKLTHSEIAGAVGKSRVTVSNTMRLLKLPSKIQQSLQKGEISGGHARALLGLKSTEDMLKLWKRIKEREESVRTTEELVAQMNSLSRQKKRKTKRLSVSKSADICKIEDDLITILGTKVTIHPRSSGGVIEVEYYSNDDLDRLLDLFSEIES